MAEYIEREAVSADGCGEVRKIKTPFARIIVGGTADKPYYHILWWDTAKKECYIGYSSYYLEYVFKWLKEEFEITEKDADVAPVVRWISVEERLPDDDVQVLACTKHGKAFSAHCENGRWRVSGSVKITHWMPLPEPPNCGADMGERKGGGTG